MINTYRRDGLSIARYQVFNHADEERAIFFLKLKKGTYRGGM